MEIEKGRFVSTKEKEANHWVWCGMWLYKGKQLGEYKQPATKMTSEIYNTINHPTNNNSNITSIYQITLN